MNYVLMGSLGNINTPLLEKLVKAGNTVTVISSNPERSAAITAAGAKPAIAHIEDSNSLAAAFKGADAVYTMIPPKWDAADWKGHIHQMGKNIASAIAASGVKKVVNLSSVGAHMPTGCGPVSGLHFAEEELNKLSGVDVKHLRPGFFYINFFASAIGLIKHMGIYGNNYGADKPVVMTHPIDIAAVAAEELLGLSFTGKSVRYIASDIKTSKEITAILGAAVGKPDLPYVEFGDEDAYKGMLQAGLSDQVASNYAEMGRAIRTGAMFEQQQKDNTPLQKTKLTDFAKEFAAAYANA
ncbi:MAG: NAD(P)H-binding protein [Bacteroidetes bacterium]|nr:NAD(P)H-binding protein [Bacteroidota bacterium]